MTESGPLGRLPALADEFRVSTVAKAIGVTPRTIYRWIEEGRIRRVRRYGPRSTFISRSEISRLVSAS